MTPRPPSVTLQPPSLQNEGVHGRRITLFIVEAGSAVLWDIWGILWEMEGCTWGT